LLHLQYTIRTRNTIPGTLLFSKFANLYICNMHFFGRGPNRVRSKRVCLMTRKEIAVEFVIPTMFAIAVGLCGLAAVAFAG
jgi:hypothetical protein